MPSRSKKSSRPTRRRVRRTRRRAHRTRARKQRGGGPVGTEGYPVSADTTVIRKLDPNDPISPFASVSIGRVVAEDED